jgi:hypothetical protein
MSSNNNNICDDPAYQNMVIQRTRFQIFNIPPIRYDNLSNNPYERINPTTGKKFTKFEIDMRRKAEILKYNPNRSSTQTNNFTKAEIYAQVVSGKYQQRTYPNYYIIDNTSNNQIESCPVNIKTPSSSSDVPGPIIDLYEDVNVPLYNYNTMIDTNYGFLTQGLTPYYGKDTWNSNIISNVSSTLNNTNKLNAIIGSIFIYYADVPYKTFSITTPISLQIIGTRSVTQDNSMNFTISDISTNIIFNNTSVNYSAITNTINNNSSQTFNIPITSSSFSITYYLGLLKITNIKLPFQKGFIFDIQPKITFSTSNNITISSKTIIFNVKSTPTNLNNKSYQIPTITAT